MPGLEAANNAASFPVALYKAYDDLKAYLARYATGLTVEQVAAQIASKDVKDTYDGPWCREAAGPERHRRRGAGVRRGDARQAPPLLACSPTPSRSTASTPSSVPPRRGRGHAGTGGSSLPTFLRFIHHCDPGSNAGVPGLTIPPAWDRPRDAVGISLDGPRGTDERLLALGMAIEQVLGRTPPPAR